MSGIRPVRKLATVGALVLTTVGWAVTPSGAQEEPPDDEAVILNATLSGAEEIDPTTGEPGAGDPDGSGTATIEVIGETTLCWSMEVEGVQLPAIGAHIHAGPPGANGPVVVPLANPNRDGISIGCTEVAAELIDDIVEDASHYYVNIHTREYPNGAVRGQLVRVARCVFGPGPDDSAPATITATGLVEGTPGDDVILTGDGADTVLGLGGDDIMCAQGGDDTVVGGPGDDTVLGDDVLAGPPFGPGGNDVMIGGGGDDELFGLGGDDTSFGGAGADFIIGFGGNDRVLAGADDDVVFAGPGDDHAVGGGGDDVMFGNFGSDTLLGGRGDDEIDGDNPNLPPEELAPGGPTEPRGASEFCLGQGGDDLIFNCEAGDPSTPRTPPPAPAPAPGDESA